MRENQPDQNQHGRAAAVIADASRARCSAGVTGRALESSVRPETSSNNSRRRAGSVSQAAALMQSGRTAPSSQPGYCQIEAVTF